MDLRRRLALAIEEDGSELVFTWPEGGNRMAPGETFVIDLPFELQPTRDRPRRFHHHDEIDGPHVDPELERARRDDRLDRARLEHLFDRLTLLARDAPVVGTHEVFLPGDLVQPLR